MLRRGFPGHVTDIFPVPRTRGHYHHVSRAPGTSLALVLTRQYRNDTALFSSPWEYSLSLSALSLSPVFRSRLVPDITGDLRRDTRPGRDTGNWSRLIVTVTSPEPGHSPEFLSKTSEMSGSWHESWHPVSLDRHRRCYCDSRIIFLHFTLHFTLLSST